MSQRFRSKTPFLAPPSVANAGSGIPTKSSGFAANIPGNPFIDIPLPIPQELTKQQIDHCEILREIKHEMNNSVYYLTKDVSKKDIDRYSDKYKTDRQETSTAKISSIQTDLSFFPSELHSVYNPSLGTKLTQTKRVSFVPFNVGTFDELERQEEQRASLEESQGLAGGKGDEEEEEEEIVPAEEYNEEEFEEETDYNLSYFEPGDDYGDYDDGGRGGDYDEGTF